MPINDCCPLPPSPLFNVANANLDSTARARKQTSASSVSSTGLTGSGRAATPPFHSARVLGALYSSNQTDHDINQLSNNFNKLHNYHKHTHEMFGHSTPGNGKSMLFNTVHPWESEIDL